MEVKNSITFQDVEDTVVSLFMVVLDQHGLTNTLRFDAAKREPTFQIALYEWEFEVID